MCDRIQGNRAEWIHINKGSVFVGSLSVVHWLIVLAVVSMVFGTGKIRSLGTDLGGALKGFKEGMTEGERETGETDGRN